MDTPSHAEDASEEDNAGKSNDRSGFSTQELMMLELVAAGRSHAAAAAAVDRSAKTVQRLLQRSAARAYVREAQAARLDQVVGLLGMASVEAARTVLEEIRGEEPTTRLRACSLALGSFERLRSAARQDSVVEDLRQGLEQLQAQIDSEEDHD